MKKTYRINGFEQIKAFYSWVFNNPDKARPTHISLYLFLINQGNRANWVEWFKCPYDLAMQGACIGNNGTYYRCLDELKQWKLIDYKKGVNNFKAPMVKIIVLYDTEQVSVPLSEQVTAQQYAQQYAQLPVHIYKLLTNNLKLITDNIEEIIKFYKDKDKVKEKKVINILFEIFWNEYDKKIDKPKCENKWNNLNDKERELIMIHIPKYLKSQPDKQYRKNPITYLNNNSWDNEVISDEKQVPFKSGKYEGMVF